MKIALIQQHATWDRDANRARGLAAARKAAAARAQVIAFADAAVGALQTMGVFTYVAGLEDRLLQTDEATDLPGFSLTG